MLLKNIMGFLLGIPFVWIGYDHFLRPEIFDPIVPSYLGFPRFWTLFSGLLEILLGIGIMIPFSRRMAARILTLFLLCVYLVSVVKEQMMKHLMLLIFNLLRWLLISSCLSEKASLKTLPV